MRPALKVQLVPRPLVPLARPTVDPPRTEPLVEPRPASAPPLKLEPAVCLDPILTCPFPLAPLAAAAALLRSSSSALRAVASLRCASSSVRRRASASFRAASASASARSALAPCQRGFRIRRWFVAQSATGCGSTSRAATRWSRRWWRGRTRWSGRARGSRRRTRGRC